MFIFFTNYNRLLFMKSMKTLITFLFCLGATIVIAQNPIVPPGVYIADPEAHTWKDGRLYVYGSRDESDDYWCSYQHHVLWTDDLITWNMSENAFTSKGKHDEVSYHDNLLFAPDCAFKNGQYYLYYCSPYKPLAEGVATSKSPFGPFKKGRHIKGAYRIDPAVLVDTDGEAYFYWGQGKPKVARLKSNMLEIDRATIVEPLDKAGNKAFHEGSSIRKIGDLYYLVFADESRKKRPTCLGYAISKSPMGPFEYKGIIIDNVGCDPAVWNNHGSIEEFDGQWYVFYHRASNNSRKFRKACVEPIKINRDGTINEVEMTSQGASKPLPAIRPVQAEWACQLTGNVRVAPVSTTDIVAEGLIKIKNNDTAVFKYLNFGRGVKEVTFKVIGVVGGIIEVRLDSPKSDVVATCTISPQESNEVYTIAQCNIVAKIKGKHAVYLTFKGKENFELFAIDWFMFNKK